MTDRTTPATGILVGVDGRPATLRAVVWAAHEAEARALPLDLVQVLPGQEEPALRPPGGRALALLDQARRIATAAVEASPAIRISVAEGRPGAVLSALAAHARLLVLGAHGVDGDLGLTVGHDVTHALAHAACPTVVVPAAWEPQRHHTGEVLVGVDGSEAALGAAAFAADVADRWQRPLAAVHVGPRASLTGPDDDTLRSFVAETVAGLAARHPGLVVHELVARGDPGPVLARLAGRTTRLIVVGARGRGALSGPLLGSTSQSVVRHARCPVAVLSPVAAPVWVDARHRRAVGTT